MTDKKVTITRHKKFQLRGSKNLFPTINFAGGRAHEPGEKIPFDVKKLDRAKLAWCAAYAAGLKLAADSTTAAVAEDPNSIVAVLRKHDPSFAQLSPTEQQSPEIQRTYLDRLNSQPGYLAKGERRPGGAGGWWGSADAVLSSPAATAIPYAGKVLPWISDTIQGAEGTREGLRADVSNVTGAARQRNGDVDIHAALQHTIAEGRMPLVRERVAAVAAGDQARIDAVDAKLQALGQTSLGSVAKQHAEHTGMQDTFGYLGNTLLAQGLAGSRLTPRFLRKGLTRSLSPALTGMKPALPKVEAAVGRRAGQVAAKVPQVGRAASAVSQSMSRMLGKVLPTAMKVKMQTSTRMSMKGRAGRGGAARGLARAAAMAQTAVGGVRGVRDLVRMVGGDGSFQDEVHNQTKNTVLANQESSKGELLMNAIDAGFSLHDPAAIRRQLGAAYGRFEWAENTPMGKAYREAKMDDSSNKAGQAAYQRAHNTFKLDPRLANLDDASLDQLAQVATRNAHAAEQLNQGRDFDKRIGSEWLDRYGQARSAVMAGNATPEQIKYLERLNGAPLAQANGKPTWTPEADQMTGRNATLYHQLGPSVADQVIAQTKPKPAATAAVTPPPAAAPAPVVVAAPKPTPAPAVAAIPRPDPTPAPVVAQAPIQPSPAIKPIGSPV